MANCVYSVPDKNVSGDNLYGTRICDQAFIDWAWNSYNFDYDYWQGGWGYDDCCNTNKPLARTFNALWLLNYSSDNPQDESYDHENIMYWAGRYVREKMSGYKLRALCGRNTTTNARTYGAGCTEMRYEVIWDCTTYKDMGYKSCRNWSDWFSWLCFFWFWVSNVVCVASGYVGSWVCEIGYVFTKVKRIELYNPLFFYQRDIVERAGILFHECRHIGGKAHNAKFPPWAASQGLAGQSGADSNWAYQGPYCWQVCWLAWYWATAQNSSPVLREKAKDYANTILGYAFAEMPTFTIN